MSTRASPIAHTYVGMRSLLASVRQILAAALIAAICGTAPSASAAAIETFVMAVGGQSTLILPFGCATFAAPAPVYNYFGAFPPSVPTDGLSTCKVAGGFRHQSTAGGTLSDATAISETFNLTQNPPNTVNGSASANARSGKVGAKADAAFTGPVNGFIVSGTSAFGKFTEPLTLHDPAIPDGTPGFAALGVTIAGSVSVAYTGSFNSTGDVEVRYQIDTGPIYTIMRAQVNNASPFVATLNGTASFPGNVLDGFTLGAGSVSGTGEITTFLFPIVWGQPFDFTLGVLAIALPGTGGTVATDFFASAHVSRIDAFALGQPVTSFTVTSGSGALYDARGVDLSAVPLSPSIVLLAPPLLGMIRRRPRGCDAVPGSVPRADDAVGAAVA